MGTTSAIHIRGVIAIRIVMGIGGRVIPVADDVTAMGDLVVMDGPATVGPVVMDGLAMDGPVVTDSLVVLLLSQRRRLVAKTDRGVV